MGQEANGATHALCMMNMLLHSMRVTTDNISWGDTLKAPHHLEDNGLIRFDVVVANPPFSLDKCGEDSAADRYNCLWRDIPAAILIFKRNRPADALVLFVDTSRDLDSGVPPEILLD